MGRRGYSGYNGRSRAWNVLRIVIAALIILLMLAVAGLIVGQRYIIYTDDGVRLELPFFQREETPSVDASVSLDIVRGGG